MSQLEPNGDGPTHDPLIAMSGSDGVSSTPPVKAATKVVKGKTRGPHKPIPEAVKRRRRSRQIAIAAVIRATRHARGMLQEELAEKSNMSKGHIGRIESTRGATTYDLTLLRMWDLLDALGLTWAEWERDVDLAMSGGAIPPPGKRDGDVALLARIVRTLPNDMVSVLVDLARALERHQSSLMNTADMPAGERWLHEAEDRARRAGMAQIDESLGFAENGHQGEDGEDEGKGRDRKRKA